MNDIPPIISAEAAVRSKRPGFISIFDPKTDVTKIESSKQFYADPQLMKDAVVQLKKAGFKVMGSDRISITIIAPVELFEQQFNVTIISNDQGLTCEGVTQIGYINTDNSAFSGVLAGIALAQTAIMNGAEPPPKQDENYQLYPWQVGGGLGAQSRPEEYLLSVAEDIPIRVAVIDTGFQYDHPYFTADNKRQLGNVTVELTSPDRSGVESLIQNQVRAINKLLAMADTIDRKSVV